MVTSGSPHKNKNKKRKYTHKPKNTGMREAKMMKIMVYALAGVCVIAVVNAAVWYTIHPPSTYVSVDQIDRVVFADVKPTPLLTEITNVTHDGNLTTVSFLASNQNATFKLDKFECSIDADTWKECISPVVVNSSEHETLEIRALDNHNGTELQPVIQLFNKQTKK